jgi:hypothetical protein
MMTMSYTQKKFYYIITSDAQDRQHFVQGFAKKDPHKEP